MIIKVHRGKDLPLKKGRVCMGLGVGVRGTKSKDVITTSTEKVQKRRVTWPEGSTNEFCFPVKEEEQVVFALIKGKGGVLARHSTSVAKLKQLFANGKKEWQWLELQSSADPATPSKARTATLSKGRRKKSSNNPLVLINVEFGASASPRDVEAANVDLDTAKPSSFIRSKKKDASFVSFNTTAIAEHLALSACELSFTMGVTVIVTDHDASKNVYFGSIGSRSGWFPIDKVLPPR